MKGRFGIKKALIQNYSHPYFYLNHDLMHEHGLDAAEVETAVATELNKFKGVSLAVPSTALVKGQMPDAALTRAIKNNYNVRRSGDIFVVFKPHFFRNKLESVTVASSHGSPWRYDTFVPIIFAGGGLKPQKVYRRVYTVDVAPTLAAWVGTKPPSGAAGQVLVEVMGQRGK